MTGHSVYSRMAYRKSLSKEQAYQKVRHYCAYQERAHREVKEKLYSLGLFKADVEELLARLIEEDYLNEERFACQFAGGKFRIKNWGRQKIRYELKQRQVSDYNIKKALLQIDAEDYEKVLLRLARKKYESIRGQGVNAGIKGSKTSAYLLQKGFEPDLIRAILKQVGQPE